MSSVLWKTLHFLLYKNVELINHRFAVTVFSKNRHVVRYVQRFLQVPFVEVTFPVAKIHMVFFTLHFIPHY